MMLTPTNANLPSLFVRLWRIRFARYAMKAARVRSELAERLLPKDLRKR